MCTVGNAAEEHMVQWLCMCSSVWLCLAVDANEQGALSARGCHPAVHTQTKLVPATHGHHPSLHAPDLDCLCYMSRSTIWQVITVNAGEHHIVQTPSSDGL